MKNKLFSIFVGLTFSLFAFSQATLPTSSGFDGAQLPSVGWTSNCDYYTASGDPMPALKFSSLGHHLTVQFASSPGNMSYSIRGNKGDNSPTWQGIFDIQESVDGLTYTAVRSYTSVDMPYLGNDYYSHSVSLDASSRYVRFILSEKVSGSNVGLDNVMIEAAPVTHQELTVEVDGQQTSNNAVYILGADVGDSNTLPFVIKNTGSVEALNITALTITGADANLFSFENEPSLPLEIAGLDSEVIGIKFSPTSEGAKNATITIASNDEDSPIFTFHVIGYGGGFALEPTAQPTALSFSSVKSYRMTGSFTASTTAEGYLVLYKRAEAVTEVPTDGVNYSKGDVIGDAKVVYSGTSTTFVPNDIIANTDYHYSVFAYNGIGIGVNYLTTNPLSGNQTSLVNMIPTGEYDNIDIASPTLLGDLQGLISPHQHHYYNDYATKMVENFYGRDTINGMRAVTCQYSGNVYLYDYPFSFGASGMSREHTYASSWFPIQDDQSNFYADYHNLLLLNQNDANAIRSNYPLGVVVSGILQNVGGSKLGKNTEGQYVYEPTDETKGAAARAMFYMATRYTDENVNWKLPSYINTNIPYGQDQNILKQWNLDFPPSGLEIARNDYIDSLQKNRNPFIDNPEYACYIDFSTMTYIPTGCEGLGLDNEVLNANLSVFPNPSKDIVNVELNGTLIDLLVVTDLTGKVVQMLTPINEFASVNVSNLPAGAYFFNIITDQGNVVRKVIVE